jgi:hypothetical protein
MLEQLSAGRNVWRHYAWVPSSTLGVVAVGFLCWGAWVYGYDPHWLGHGHSWWLSALQVNQNWTLIATMALWLAGLSSFWWPRRHQRLPIGLIVVVVMVIVTAALGTASLVPCRGGISTIGVTFWILQLYVGQPSPAYAPGAAVCSGQPPLALQLGQSIGLGATLIGAVAVAAVLWRQPVERLRSRFAREVTIFTGLDALTLPLLTRLSDPASGRKVIVIEPDETHPLLDEARATGARVIIGDPAETRLLEPIISGWRGWALDRLYALRCNVAENDRVLSATRSILGRHPRTAEHLPHLPHLPHLVTRIDDPRHANQWRGSHGGTSAGFEDALSAAETTAYTLIDTILRTSARQLILCGDDGLTLAILIELDRRGWEQGELLSAATHGRAAHGRAARPEANGEYLPRLPAPLSIGRVVLIDPRAADIRREYLVSTPRTVPDSAVTTRTARWQDELLPTLDAMTEAIAQGTAVIIVDSFSEMSMHKAGRVARLHPNTWIYVQTPSGDSVSEAIFNRLCLFQSGLLIAGEIPEDTWMRVARHWHECFRLQDPVPPDHPKAPGRRPWADLSDFLRNDNLRQVRSILSEVAGLGRQWVPVRAVPEGSHIELSERELEAVAMAEHIRWYRRRLATKRADGTDGGAPASNLMMPWCDLSANEQATRREWVRSQVAQLEDVGFMPVIPAGGPPGASGYERVGIVEARQLNKRYSWLRPPGEKMQGMVGDWRVIDNHGQERTVGDAEFRASHVHLGGRRWHRTGRFLAWQVSERLTVRTKEGTATADAGDWVVEGVHGERWPIWDEQFKWSYRPAPVLPDGPAPRDQASTPAATSSSTAPTISS